MPYSSTYPLVTPEWLAQHLSDPDVVILDCRWRLTEASYGEEAFRSGHIPGAHFVDLHHDLSAPPDLYGGRHPLPAPDAFAARMGALGVDHSRYVVCYDDDGAGAARCWWLLQFYGQARVSVLDGGFPRWVEERHAVTRDASTPHPTEFVAVPDPRMVIDYDTLRRIKSSIHLVDARAPERYQGLTEPVDRIAGHIPGAYNQPFATVLDHGIAFKGPEAQRALWAPVLDESKSVAVYCGSGVTACADILALRLTGAEPLLYPGSWSDWIQHQEAPVSRA